MVKSVRKQKKTKKSHGNLIFLRPVSQYGDISTVISARRQSRRKKSKETEEKLKKPKAEEEVI